MDIRHDEREFCVENLLRNMELCVDRAIGGGVESRFGFGAGADHVAFRRAGC